MYSFKLIDFEMRKSEKEAFTSLKRYEKHNPYLDTKRGKQAIKRIVKRYGG